MVIIKMLTSFTCNFLGSLLTIWGHILIENLIFTNTGNGSFLVGHETFIWTINTLRPWQNGRHFADDILKCIFLNENVWIPIKISLKFVPKGPINNIPALVEIMAWRRPGDKPLSEPVTVGLPTHICVTRPQWVNTLRLRQNGLYFTDNIFKCIFLNENILISIKISQKFVPKDPVDNIPSLVQIMAWRWTGDKPLSEPMMAYVANAYMHHSALMN